MFSEFNFGVCYSVLDFFLSFCDLCIYGCSDKPKAKTHVVLPTCEFVIKHHSSARDPEDDSEEDYGERKNVEEEEVPKSPLDALLAELPFEDFNTDLLSRFTSVTSPNNEGSEISSQYNINEYEDFLLVEKYILLRLNLVYNAKNLTLSAKFTSKEPIGNSILLTLLKPNALPLFLDCKYKEKKCFESIPKAQLKDMTLNVKLLHVEGVYTIRVISVFDEMLSSLANVKEVNNLKRKHTDMVLLPLNETEDSCGFLRMSLSLDLVKETLIVTVVQGKYSNTSRLMDSYCTVEITTRSTILGHNKTSIKKKTNKPIWNEAFTFDVTQNNLNDNLLMKVKVLDNNQNRPVSFGTITFSAKAYFRESKHWFTMINQQGQVITHWHSITPAKTKRQYF